MKFIKIDTRKCISERYKKMMKVKKYNPIRIYVIFLIGYLIQISYLPEEYPIMKIVFFALYGMGYILGFIQLLSQSWSKHAKKCAVVMMAIALMVFIFNGNIGMEARFVILNLVWLLLCLRDVDFERLILIDLKIRVIFTASLFLLCKIGLLTNVVVVRDYSRERFAWGYGHPNTAGSVLFLIALYLMYVRRKKLNYIDIVIQCILALITYRVFNSKTSLAGIAMVVLYSVFCIISRLLLRRKKEHTVKVLRRVIFFAPVLIMILMFTLSALYNPSSRTMQILNKLLTSRLEQGGKILDYYNPSLFGNNIVRLSWNDALEAGINTAVVGSDVLFIYIYTTFGIASLIMYVFILVKNLKYSIKQNFCLTYCMVIMLAVSCVENQYVNVGSNIFLVCFSCYIYGVGYIRRAGHNYKLSVQKVISG